MHMVIHIPGSMHFYSKLFRLLIQHTIEYLFSRKCKFGWRSNVAQMIW